MTITEQIEKARAQLDEAQTSYDTALALVDNLARTLAIARRRLATLEAKVAAHATR